MNGLAVAPKHWKTQFSYKIVSHFWVQARYRYRPARAGPCRTSSEEYGHKVWATLLHMKFSAGKRSNTQRQWYCIACLEVVPVPMQSDYLLHACFVVVSCALPFVTYQARDNYLLTSFLPSLSLCPPSDRPPCLGIAPHSDPLPSWHHPQPSAPSPSP